jgi:hypothetical protein
MKTEAEISYLWQLANLKFHFGAKLAMDAVHPVVAPPMKSVNRSDQNEFQLDRLQPEFRDSQAGSAGLGEKSVDVRSADQELPEQSPKKPAAGAPNLRTRIA